jgi:hypothetical protein
VSKQKQNGSDLEINHKIYFSKSSIVNVILIFKHYANDFKKCFKMRMKYEMKINIYDNANLEFFGIKDNNKVLNMTLDYEV